MTEEEQEIVDGSELANQFFPQVLCEKAAPLVINGVGFCGCQKPKGHDGKHEVTIKWES